MAREIALIDGLAAAKVRSMLSRLRFIFHACVAGFGLLLVACEPVQQTQAQRNHPQRNGFGQPINVGLNRMDGIGDAPLTRPPSVFAESAMVVDINQGRILYAKNIDQKRAVASTQKIITALCVLDAGDLNKKVRIAASDGHCEPTKLGLKAGEVYTRKQLLEVLMVKSANDVARALARDVAGSQAAFRNKMNQKCAQLGMRNSHFKNPHGLTEPGQFSTARDIAIAAIAAYRQPTMRRMVKTEEITFRFNDGRKQVLTNTNKVLKTLPYCNGMKTGTTRASGRCLVATGSLRGRDVVTIVLKSNSKHVWEDSMKLLRWSLERPLVGFTQNNAPSSPGT